MYFKKRLSECIICNQEPNFQKTFSLGKFAIFTVEKCTSINKRNILCGPSTFLHKSGVSQTITPGLSCRNQKFVCGIALA